MATITLRNNVFAVADTVSLYLASAKAPGASAPSGSAITTADVASDGTLTFTGLTEGVDYIAYKSGTGAVNFKASSPTRTTAMADARMSSWAGTAVASNIDRRAAVANLTATTSGTLFVAGGLVLPAGQTVSTITAFSATTAGGTLTVQQFGLINAATGVVLARTADAADAAWAANTKKTLTLATPYTPTDDLAVYVGIVIAASTVPTLRGATLGHAVISSGYTPTLCGTTADTSLTAHPAVGATIGAITATADLPFVAVG